MTKTIEHNTVKVASFNLELPEAFNQAPTYTVELPAKYKALIYNVERVKTYGLDDEKPTYVSGWRIMVVNRSGAFPRKERYGESNDYTTHNPLDVQVFLRETALRLSKLVKVNRTEYDPSDDE